MNESSARTVETPPHIFPCWFQLSLTRQGDSINADQWYVEDGNDFQDMMSEVKVYLSEALRDATGFGTWSFNLIRMDNQAVLDYYVKLEQGAYGDAPGKDERVSGEPKTPVSRRVEEHRHIIS